MNLLLGIDLGTSYFKVGLFDRTGDMKGLGRVRVSPQAPQLGRQELAVAEFWGMLRSGVAAALTQAGARANDITALSYASQANSFVLLDGSDAPLTPLVLWTDARATPLEAELQAFSRTATFARTVGFAGLNAGFAASKWRWFQRHEPAIWTRVRRAMTMADYLVFSLTGQAVGDASTAAFLGLYDLRAQRWWSEALAAFGIKAELLSSPLRPGAPSGRTTAAAEVRLGVPAGIPFAVGALDHHAAAVGAGLGRLAEVSISTGTVLAALTIVAEPAPVADCLHGPHVDGRGFYRLAFDPRGATQLEEYQRAHAPGRGLEELIALAMAAGDVPLREGQPGADVRRLLDQINATHAQLLRRVSGGERPRGAVATGGAIRSAAWLQLLANALGLPVVASACPEPACLGAAMFGAVAAGWHRDLAEAASAMTPAHRTFEPGAAPTERDHQSCNQSSAANSP